MNLREHQSTKSDMEVCTPYLGAALLSILALYHQQHASASLLVQLGLFSCSGNTHDANISHS
jgi:hypothetical protein